MFVKVNGPGWAFGDKLTSAQMNQLDADHARALDGSVAGDNLHGVVGFVSGGQIQANIPGAIIANNGNGIQSTVANGITTAVAQGIVSNAAQGIVSFSAGGIQPGVAGGINDGGVAQGIKATVANGIVGTVLGGIAPTVAGGISDGGIVGGIRINAAGGLETRTAGAIKLNGGSADYPTYVTPRVYTKNIALGLPFGGAAPFSPGTGWTFAFASGPMLIGGATTNVLTIPLNGFFNNGGAGLNGSTLTQATLVFAVKGPHTGLPTLPFLDIRRIPTAAGNPSSSNASLYSSAPQSMGTTTGTWTAPASAAAWDASSNFQSYVTTPNQNNAIDLLNYVYYATIQDESGSNIATGNMYLALQLTFGNITNMAPG
jgi:hypothetical protein